MATASRSSVSGSLRRSVEMEEVEDEDNHSTNIPPSNVSRFIESSDESNNDEDGFVGGKRVRASSPINIDDDSSEGVSAVEETDEAERGKIINLSVSVCLHRYRSPLERLERTNLCVLPPCSIH